MASCIVCDNNELIGALPPREEIVVEGNWRVAHAFGTTLPGWLVVVPTRHVTALHEVDPEDAAVLGALLHRASRALCDVVACEKAYFAFYAEAAAFEHLHVHVIPRMAWFTSEQRGPGAFSMLGASPADEVPEAERDRLALLLRTVM